MVNGPKHNFRMTIMPAVETDAMQSICEKFIMNLKFDIFFRFFGGGSVVVVVDAATEKYTK